MWEEEKAEEGRKEESGGEEEQGQQSKHEEKSEREPDGRDYVQVARMEGRSCRRATSCGKRRSRSVNR